MASGYIHFSPENFKYDPIENCYIGYPGGMSWDDIKGLLIDVEGGIHYTDKTYNHQTDPDFILHGFLALSCVGTYEYGGDTSKICYQQYHCKRYIVSVYPQYYIESGYDVVARAIMIRFIEPND